MLIFDKSQLREDRGRVCWQHWAPQEVIATICGEELMGAWESRLGTMQLHQFALAQG